MTVTFLLGRATKESLTFGVSPIAELGSILHLITDPSHHAPLADISGHLRSTLDDPALERLDALSPLWRGYRCRIFFPLQHDTFTTIDDDLARINALEENRFVEIIVWGILGGHSRAPSLQRIRMVDGEKEVIRRARTRSDSAYSLARSLFADPNSVRQRIMTLINEVAIALQEPWLRSEAILRADVQLRRRIIDREGLVSGLTGLTHSSRLLTNPDRIAFDKVHHGVIDLEKKPILALPSRYGWPHLLTKHEPGWPALIQYPLEPTVAVRGIPSSHVIQERLAALSDVTRLRVCRLLAREQLTTTELARITNVSKPQMARTIRQLRECNLLSQTRRGHFVFYQLDVEAINQLGSDLLVSLIR